MFWFPQKIRILMQLGAVSGAKCHRGAAAARAPPQTLLGEFSALSATSGWI